MSDLTTEIVINLAGNLRQRAQQYTGAMARFSAGNSRMAAVARRSFNVVNAGLDKFHNRYAGMGTAFITGTVIKGVADMDKSIRRLGTDARMSDKDLLKLKNQIKDIANQKDISGSMLDLTDGVNELQALTGSAEFVKANIRNVGLAMQGFGVDAITGAKLLGQFYEKGIRGSAEVEKTMDMLFSQFAKGSISVQDVARVAPKLFSIIQGKGPGAIAQMGGLLQVVAKNKGSAEETVTAIQGVYSALSNVKNIKFLKGVGIDVFIKDTKKMKDPVALLTEILKSADYDGQTLQDIFTSTDLQGLSALYDPANRALLNDMISGNYKLGVTQAASEKNAKGLYSALDRLKNIAMSYADENIASPLISLANGLSGLDTDTVKAGVDVLVKATAAIVGALAVRGGYRAVSSLFGSVTGRTRAGSVAGLGVQRVFVVNMGVGMGGLRPVVPTIVPPIAGAGLFARAQTAIMATAGAALRYALPTYMAYTVADVSSTLIDNALANKFDGYREADIKFSTGLAAFFGKKSAQQYMVEQGHVAPDEYRKSNLATPYRPSAGLNNGMSYGAMQPPTPQPLDGKINVSVEVTDNRKPKVKVSLRDLPGQSMKDD